MMNFTSKRQLLVADQAGILFVVSKILNYID